MPQYDCSRILGANKIREGKKMPANFKKHPYIYIFSVIILLILIWIPSYNAYINATTEKELQLLMAGLKNQPATLEEFAVRMTNPRDEDNALFYYRQAANASWGDLRWGDYEETPAATQLIKQGNSKKKCYPGDGLEILRYYMPRLTEDTPKKEIQRINYCHNLRTEIGRKYSARIQNEINSGKYNAAYEDMLDWLIFLQKSFKNDSLRNNVQKAFEIGLFLKELDLAGESMNKLIKASPNGKYSQRLIDEIGRIIQMQTAAAKENLNLELVYGLSLADSVNKRDIMKKYGIQKYHLNKRKIAEIKTFLQVKKLLTAQNPQELERFMTDYNEFIEPIRKNYGYLDTDITSRVWEKTLKSAESWNTIKSQLKEISQEYGPGGTETPDSAEANADDTDRNGTESGYSHPSTE